MANYNATSGTLDTSFLSLYNQAKPQISNVWWWRYGYFCGINAFNTMGMTRNVAGNAAQHLEAGHPVPNWHVAAVITPAVAAGDPIVLSVTANDTINDTVYPAVGETVRFMNTKEGYISAKTQVGSVWRLTILPLDSSWVLTSAAGEGVWMIDQMSIEGSQSPNNAKVIPSELVSYPLQIIRNVAQLTGSAELTELWSDVDQFGRKINPYYLETINLEMEHTTYWDNAVFFGYPNFNTSAVSGNRMYGMDYTISNGGYTQLYPTGLFTLVDLQTMARVAMKRTAGNEFLGIGGPDFNFAAQSGLSGVFSQNPIVYQTGVNNPYAAKFVSNETELTDTKGIAINIRRVNWGGVNFNFMPIQRFGQTQTGGETGFKESGYCFWIPLSKSQTQKGDLKDRFQLTAREYQGKTRKMQMWSYGAAAPANKNGYDGQLIECLSEVGTEYYDIEKFIICKPF